MKHILYFTIKIENNLVNIFLIMKHYDLVGWQTEDIYQNRTVTFLSSI